MGVDRGLTGYFGPQDKVRLGDAGELQLQPGLNVAQGRLGSLAYWNEELRLSGLDLCLRV